MNKHANDKIESLNNLKRFLIIMKVTVFFLFLSSFIVQATNSYSQEARFSISLKSVSIKEVCRYIEQENDYIFVFADNAENAIQKRINVDIRSKNIEETLENIFYNTNLAYKILDKQIVVYASTKAMPAKEIERIVLENTVQQQDRKQISGKVVDAKGVPVIGASVIEAGTTNGKATDVDGNFSLIVNNNASIQISSIGFVSQTISTAGKTQINVTLQEALEDLGEVVVVAYGVQKKQTVTGAISTVSNATLIQTPVANVTNMLIGNVAGVTGLQTTGEPGLDAAMIRIRGMSTLNAEGQTAIVIVDGIETTLQALNAIDAHEIDNISILKDASSTAVYGVRGANGVIIVTTKRGKQGKPKISFTYNYGLTQLASRLKFLNSYDYVSFRNEAIMYDNDPEKLKLVATKDQLWKFSNNRDYTPDEVAQMNISDEAQARLLNSPAIYYTSHDYFGEMLGGASPQMQVNLNLTGGTENVKYFTSVGYLNQEGTFANSKYGGNDINSYYNRYNFRSNFDFNLLKYFTLTVDMATQFAKNGYLLGNSKDGDPTSQYSRYKNIMGKTFVTTPFSGPGFVDGKLVGYFVDANNPLKNMGITGGTPTSDLFYTPYLTTYNTNFNTNIKLRHNMEYLTKGLSLTGTVSYSDVYRKGISTQHYVPLYTITRDSKDPSKIMFMGGTLSPTWVTDNTNRYKWRRVYFEMAANYRRSFGKHDVSALYLLNAQKTFDPSLLYSVPNGLMGMVGRVTYQFDNRYMAEVNMGYNGSENFPEHKRFGFFPAFSAGWIISNEKFFPQNDFLTYLKLRGSYGEVGNDKIGNNSQRFLYLPNAWGYSSGTIFGGYAFGTSNGSAKDPFYPGARETFVGNPNVTWERAKKKNLGVEINFFKDRLMFTGNIFSEKRSNILWSSGVVPGTVGFNIPPSNLGVVSNRGYELDLGWADRVSHFEYGAKFTVSYAKNTIEYIAEPPYPYPWMNTTGYSIGQFKGYLTNGFYNSVEEAADHPYTTIDGNRVQPGDLRYVDVTGDGIVDTRDRVPIGFSNWPRYNFSSTIHLGYKGFRVNLLFIGAAQGSIVLDNLYIRNPFYASTGAAMQWQYDGRWTPEKAAQGAEIIYPRASMRTNDNINGVTSDFWLRSKDFIRLKNAEISYTFPQSDWINSMGITGLRVYANGNNLLTWTKLLPGIDPEQADGSGASAGYVYPMTRIFNFGFNLQF